MCSSSVVDYVIGNALAAGTYLGTGGNPVAAYQAQQAYADSQKEAPQPQPYVLPTYSSQHATVTGSGGRQAAAVLASEIKQARSLRQRQAEVADYGLGMDVTGTGLQIA